MKTPARAAGSVDLQTAVDRFNADHRRTWGRAGGGTCPICGHHKCFGEARGKLAGTGRWACFSANHGNIGVKLGACVHGDALDVDAIQAGRNRVDHLRTLGYLTAIEKPCRWTQPDALRALGHDPDENEREFLEERAGYRMFLGGQSLGEAERGALADLVRSMERERQARHA